MNNQEALIVVDYQNGFIPLEEGGTGELWVEWGWNLAPIINTLMQETRQRWWIVIATRDWHPEGHMSFAANYKDRDPFTALTVANLEVSLTDRADFNNQDLKNEFWADGMQILWPDHCIAGTKWAEYFKDLDQNLIDAHVIKWYDPTTEMYSWFAWKQQRTDDKIIKMKSMLTDAWVGLVKVVALATDYCVNATALDALKEWFKVEVLTKAIAGVSPEDSVKRLQELREQWVQIID